MGAIEKKGNGYMDQSSAANLSYFGKQENGGKGWDIKSAYPVPKNYYPVLITSI